MWLSDLIDIIVELNNSVGVIYVVISYNRYHCRAY